MKSSETTAINSNSVFLLKVNLLSYIQSSQSIVLFHDKQIQQYWKKCDPPWKWLPKLSALFSCQIDTRLLTLLRWVVSPLHVHPLWCFSPSSWKGRTLQRHSNYSIHPLEHVCLFLRLIEPKALLQQNLRVEQLWDKFHNFLGKLDAE